MKTSIAALRALVILAGAAGGAGLASACSQIIGADFDVTLGSSSASSGGGGGDAGPDSGPDAGPGGGGGVGVASAASAGGGGAGGGGTTCNVNPCPPETVAGNQDFPWGLVVKGGSVYWTTAGASSSPGPPTDDGSIYRASVSVNGPIDLVLGKLVAPNQIATDGVYLYWTSTANAPDGAVYRCLISGCVKELVAANQDAPTGVTVHGAHVYWTVGDGWVRRRLLDQKADGGAGIDGEAKGFDHPNLITGDATNLYFTEYSPSGQVWRIDDNLTAVAMTLDMDTPTGIVVFGSDVCYTTYVADGVVQCFDKGTFEPTTMVASAQSYPAGLTTDGKALYWANGDAAGRIMRWRPGDEQPTEIASNQPFPNGIVIAGKWVYWTNHVLGGSVMRVLKD